MIKNLLSVAVLLIVLLQLPSVSAQDWPEFLGAGGTARSTDKVPHDLERE